MVGMSSYVDAAALTLERPLALRRPRGPVTARIVHLSRRTISRADQCGDKLGCTGRKFQKEMRMTTRTLTVSRLALAAAAGAVSLLINDHLSLTAQPSLISQADARVGRPLTPVSTAGVARRTERRAVRRGAVAAGPAVGASPYSDADNDDDAYASGNGPYDNGYAAYPGGNSAYDNSYNAYGSGGSGDPNVAPGAGYGPGPVPGSVIVNPNTGRWCTFEPSGWHWCWTP